MKATRPFSNKKRMATWGRQATKLEAGIILLMAGGSVFAEASLSPDKVEASLHPNESIVIEKTVTTPALPPKIDVCLLEDETGSFVDDINNLKMAAPGIYDTVIAKSPEARFAVAGFRDYPIDPYGAPGDWVYWLRSLMNSDKTAWIDGVNSLTDGGGADMPEAQYDAIVAALNGLDDPTKGLQSPCNFDPNPNVTKVLLVATDAPFHIPTGGSVLVTNLDHEILSLGQLYRDRADAENAFDELKNQWGWGGFTTHDLHRCQLSARAVALIYNGWSLFVRLASPEARREAITSRPWLMSSIGRRTEHTGQTTINLTELHAHFDQARQVLMQVSARLQAWAKEIAEQLLDSTVWLCVCEHL